MIKYKVLRTMTFQKIYLNTLKIDGSSVKTPLKYLNNLSDKDGMWQKII